MSIKKGEGKGKIGVEGVIYENREVDKDVGEEEGRGREGYGERRREG